MNSSIACVDPVRLRELLGKAADSPERRELDAHLHECERCRRVLFDVTAEIVRGTVAGLTADQGTLTGPSDAGAGRLKELEFLDPPSDSPAPIHRLSLQVHKANIPGCFYFPAAARRLRPLTK